MLVIPAKINSISKDFKATLKHTYTYSMKIFEVTVVLFTLVLVCQAGYHASPFYSNYYGKGISHFSYPHYGFGSLNIPRTVYGLGRYGGYGYGSYGGYGGFGGFPGIGFGRYPFFSWGGFDDFDFFD